METTTGVTLTVERYNDLLDGERELWNTLKAHGKLVTALQQIRDGAREALATDLREIDWSHLDALRAPAGGGGAPEENLMSNVPNEVKVNRRPSDDAFRFFTGPIEMLRLSRTAALRVASDIYELAGVGGAPEEPK